MTEEQMAYWRALGARVKSPTKKELAIDIAAALEISPPAVSRGSSVESKFLDRIHTALTRDESTKTDAYRKAERVLQDVGLTYDPFWDTSESSDTGGSTVTNRAYSRIRSAVTRVPRCFLIDVTDALPDAGWQAGQHVTYRYDENTGGRGALNDAGPGSRIVFFARNTSPTRIGPRANFVAHGEVSYIGPGWTGPWQATVANYTEMASRTPAVETSNAITEINFETYEVILNATDSEWLHEASNEEEDPGGDVVAKRVLEEIPAPAVAPALSVPDVLPTGDLPVKEATTPTYSESPAGDELVTSDLPRTPSNSARNKLAETRAVDLSDQALQAQGWTMKRDRQKEGVGYDLLYVKGERELHVEVKGIMSSTLAFNLTPKESWRVETDADFVVIAVTNVLSPAAFNLHLLTRDQLAQAPRIITGYRLKF